MAYSPRALWWLVVVAAVGISVPTQAQNKFLRGDTNADGTVNVSDALALFNELFSGTDAPDCDDAKDSNDDGSVDISDGVFDLLFLFSGGDEPPAPGVDVCGFDPTADGLSCNVYNAPNCEQTPPDSSLIEAGHVLNRLGYGPTQAALDEIEAIGVSAYIERQLNPATIDESGNTTLNSRIDALFTEFQPTEDTVLMRRGIGWRYLKGTAAPPVGWDEPEFDDSSWAIGAAPLGYGEDEIVTEFEDMEDSYVTFYARTVFNVNPADVDDLIFRVNYDDGVVLYLNGTRVLTRFVSGTPTFQTTAADGHESGTFEEFNLSTRKDLLVDGANVLAAEVHNVSLSSSDAYLDVELVDRTELPGEPLRVIDGVRDLQSLLHVRGIYSERQLEAALAEFWENHLTTDYDKVAEYLDELENSDGSDAMSEDQARREAAQMEFLEYEFFRENALGNFGDLLKFSATSPTMLIYLDNVVNFKAEPNENYSREALELYTFGVDNRYTQVDIEQLARVFTGWSICKVEPDEAQTYPMSATNPPTDCGIEFTDQQLMGTGSGWRYLKGTAEPTPDQNGEATTAWTMPEFDDSTWTAGSTSIGYGDGDDRTTLSDMRGNYLTVYLRREVEIPDPSTLNNLLLELRYDDGYVAYLNGVEIGRSDNMEGEGSPPPFDEDADNTHEEDDPADYINLSRFPSLVQAGTNTLAIQVHNASLSSSDLSIHPRLIDRTILGGIEAGHPQGIWTFRYDASEHDTGSKRLFAGTPYEVLVPSRSAANGLQDAFDVFDAMIDHPSTAEFICVKLIQRFVSDRMTFASYKAGTTPPELLELLADCIAAWNSTTPKGNIETVMRAMLDPTDKATYFWSPDVFREKLKTPMEFFNSTVRALDGTATTAEMPYFMDRAATDYFTQDDPDGHDEAGQLNTTMNLDQIEFARGIAENQRVLDDISSFARWSSTTYLNARGVSSAEEIVDYFDALLFQSTLGEPTRNVLLEFLTTNSSGDNPLALDPARSDYARRVREFVGFVLSLPQWHFQ